MEEGAGSCPLLNSIRQRLRTLSANPLNVNEPFIFRLPSNIREVNKAEFEPQLVSIGPYHRLQSKEEHKWRSLKILLSKAPDNSLEECVKSIKTLEDRTRRCYAEMIHLTSDEFVMMLLLDIGFIIEFITERENKEYSVVFQPEWERALVRNDLLMMENQIPFFLLQSMFNVIVPGADHRSLLKLIFKYMTGEELGNRVFSITSSSQVRHLLHFYHECYICHMQFRSSAVDVASTFEARTRAPYTIPCASDLKYAGIRFKTIQSGGNFLDVKFRNGTMEMPYISIEESTKSRLMNLVAFEQCNGATEEKNKLSSYVALMDSLIDTVADVAILEESGILENMLPSREEAANFFNQLSRCARIDMKKHYLARLFEDVNGYYGISWNRYRAKLRREYFDNPWAIISFAGAIFLLILTFVQTFFSVYAYIKPPAST